MSHLAELVAKPVVSYIASPMSKKYAQHTVDVILGSFPKVVEIPDDGKMAPDLYIFHITEKNLTIHRSSFVVMISGEPWYIQNKINMAISPFRGQNAEYDIYYPFLYSSLFERRIHTLASQQKTKFCAFMYYKSYPHRDRLFHLISKINPVTSLGNACKSEDCLPNTRFVNDEKETYNDIAVKAYASYKYVLAVENTWKDGYFTEKIINPIIAHSVPLYWGHPSVFEYINKKRVIYMPDYTDTELLKLLKNMKDEKYKAILAEPWYAEKGDPEKVQAEFTQQIQSLFQSKK